MPLPVHLEPPVYDPSKRGIAPSQVAHKRELAIRQLGDAQQSTDRDASSCININLIGLEDSHTWQVDRQAVTLSSIGQRFTHVGIEGTVARKDTVVREAMHCK